MNPAAAAIPEAAVRVLRPAGRAIAALLVLGCCLASTAARSLIIESFEADITVRPDGMVEIVETIRPRFTGSWNGIYRTFPVEYRTPQGLNYTLLLDIESVTDQDGRDLRYESSREHRYRKLKIWLPGATDATIPVRIRYRTPNALRFFDEKDENFSGGHDELYWNVTGDEWEAPISSARATIHLPPGAAGLRAKAFTGAYGSAEEEARVNVGANSITVEALRPLDFHEGLTIAAGWDSGLVERPGWGRRAAYFIRANWPLLIPLIAFALMFRWWRIRGRDPRLRPVSVCYEPPEQLTPAELGTLLDNSPDIRDVIATLVDLSVRGYLTIEETEQDRLLGLWSSRTYAFARNRERQSWTELLPHEQRLLDALFSGDRDSVKLAELQNKFYKDLPGIKDRIYDRLVERRYYASRPDKVKQAFTWGGVAAGVLIAWLGSAASDAFGVSPLASVIAGALTALIIILFGRIMPARTAQGARALEGVLGFEEFLQRVEGERLEKMVRTPELFEKYLPFAMALGVERKWAEAFADVCRQPPSWYRGGDLRNFHSHSFVNDLSRMSTQAGSAMRSAPRSSGGSGFRGGRSGGGFGGGGGGGF